MVADRYILRALCLKQTLKAMSQHRQGRRGERSVLWASLMATLGTLACSACWTAG